MIIPTLCLLSIPCVTSLPTAITFSTSSINPTTATINNYYSTGQFDSLFIKVDLIGGEIYCFFKDGPFAGNLYLYSNSGFSDEIESTDSYCILYAPAFSSSVYLKWITEGGADKTFGVFQAEKLTTQQILDGVSLTYTNDDWAKSFVYFTIPECEFCENYWEYEVTSPSVWKYREITTQSGDAYNYNELKSGLHHNSDYFENQGSDFAILFSAEGTLQFIFTSSTDSGNVFRTILIVIGSIIGGITFLILSIVFFSSIVLPLFQNYSKNRRRNRETKIQRNRNIRSQQLKDSFKVPSIMKEDETKQVHDAAAEKLKIIAPKLHVQYNATETSMTHSVDLQKQGKIDTSTISLDYEKPVVIDGSNVAHNRLNDIGCVNDLIRMRKELLEKGFSKVQIIIGSGLYRNIDNTTKLEALKSESYCVQAPNKLDDDTVIIRYALQNDGYIVSNDNYRDWVKRNNKPFDFLLPRIIKYVIFDDKIDLVKADTKQFID